MRHSAANRDPLGIQAIRGVNRAPSAPRPTARPFDQPPERKHRLSDAQCGRRRLFSSPPGANSCWAAMVNPGTHGRGRPRSHQAPPLPGCPRHGLSTRRIGALAGCPLLSVALDSALYAHATGGHSPIVVPTSRSHTGKIYYHPQCQLLLTQRLSAVPCPCDHSRGARGRERPLHTRICWCHRPLLGREAAQVSSRAQAEPRTLARHWPNLS
jgi:hypothetical protein